MLCACQKKEGEKDYEPSEETGYVQMSHWRPASVLEAGLFYWYSFSEQNHQLCW